MQRHWYLPALAILTAACAHATTGAPTQPAPVAEKPSDFILVAPAARLDYIARAPLFEPRDITAIDTRTGPLAHGKHKQLPSGATIECYFQYEALGGATRKFQCVGAPDPDKPKSRLPVIVTDASGQPVDVKLDKVKIRYGNVKVFSSVILTRLAWALGMGSDVETPLTKVICHGCSLDPFHQKATVDETHEFPKPGDLPQVSIEQKMDGTGIYVTGTRFSRDKGEDTPAWKWQELDVITDPDRRAQADAVKLFAALIQHVDSKALQNRLLCLSNADSTQTTCPDPFLYVHDFGNSLGSSHVILGFIHTPRPLDLRHWKNTRVWKDEKKCVAAVHTIYGTGPGLTNPVISEAGRRLLADRLTLLINAKNPDGSSKLRDIFDAAHIEKYDDHGRHYTADDWVAVFVARAGQIIDKKEPCSSP